MSLISTLKLQASSSTPIRDLLYNSKVVEKVPDSLADLINPVILTISVIMGLVSLFALIFAGYNYLIGANTSDTAKISQAQKTIYWALIGLVLLGAVFFLFEIIGILLGVPNITNPDNLVNPSGP